MQFNEKNAKVLYNSSHKINHASFQPKDTSNHWHLSREIRSQFSPEGEIKLMQDDNSGMVSIYYNDKYVAHADSDSLGGRISLETPFYGKQKVVFLKNYDINLFYLRKIIKNYLFFMDFISDKNLYSTFSSIIDDEYRFFEELVSNSNGYLKHKFPFWVEMKSNEVLILIPDEDISFVIKSESEHIWFSVKMKKDGEVTKSVNFSNFIKKFNKQLYNEKVFKKIQIEAKDFKVEHKKLLMILNH